MASKEYDVFMEVFTRMSDEVALNPGALANELFREKLIPKSIWTNVIIDKSEKVDKANLMMVWLETKISRDGKVMYQMLSALRRIHDLGGIVQDIEDKLGALDLKQASESKLLIQQHIQKQGQLKGVCSLKMLLCGPPETGKTTTLLRLTNNPCYIDPDGLQLPSTVLDKPRTIQLHHMLIGDEKIWNFEENMKKLGQSLYSLILDPCHTTGAQTAISDVRAGSSGRQDTAAVRKIDLEEVTQLAEAREWEEVKKKLTEFERITILYVIDSGGQPECHEILPLLLDGHILSLIFLDLTKELGDKHPVLFRTGKTTASTQKPLSDVTTGEVIQRIMASVSSLQSDRYKSFAVFVGTYLDKATQRQVLSLDRAVQSAFKVFIDENIVCPVEDKLTEYIVTLDNTSNDQGDIESLRKLILRIVDEQFRHDQKDGVPTGWMLLHLLLRHKYQEKGWCTMAECIATAVSCGITEKELPLVLKYIHKNYGTILYYPDVLQDIVICDPNVILSPLKSAFEFVFACKFVTKEAVTKRIRNTGEISQDDLEYCFKKDGVSLPTPDVIALFKYSHILCETGSRNFFMPCLLQTDNNIIEEANDPQSLASLNPAPILFVPMSEIQINCATPLGVFSALAVEMSADGKWKCNKSEFCFKNRIQFDVVDRTSGRTYTIELRLYATYIEVRHIHGCIDTKVLVAFHRELCDALNRISQQFGHTKGIKWNWGFYCPGSLKEGGCPHLALVKREVPAVQDMTCIFDPPCRNRITDLEEKHKRWFERAIQPPPVQGSSFDEDELTPPAKKLKISSQSTDIGLDANKDDPLNKQPEMNDFLTRVACQAMDKWAVFGLQLNIEPHQLNMIQKDSPILYFVEVFDIIWKRKSNPPFTWATIVKVLRSPVVNENKLAKEIEDWLK